MLVRFWLVSLLFSVISFSADAFSKVVVRSEESRWIVEVLTEDTDGWPKIQERKTFPTEEEALKVASNYKLSFISPFGEVSFSPKMVPGSLWETKQAWSLDWEHRYAQWIESEVDTEFFVRHKIATDCADVAYALRWIFARLHGLPAAAKIGGSNVLMTNETVRSQWAKLPTAEEWYKDRRFLAALDYLLNMTYTHTLWGDSFPVALSKEALLSGSYHLSLRDQSGHTQVIHWLGEGADVPFLTLNSTVPRKVRSLSDSMLFASYPKDKEGAILRFRWAVKTPAGIILKNAKEMPGYSLEQYSFKSDKEDFSIALFEHLGFTGGKEAIREYIYKDLLEQFHLRVSLVEEGYAFCQKADCKPGTEAYEEWSTPSRDSRIKGKIGSLRSLGLRDAPESAKLSEEVLNTEGVSWSLKSMIWNWKNAEFDSDPRASITQRWGAGKESWVLRQKNFYSDNALVRYQHLEKSRMACRTKRCSFGGADWDALSASRFDTKISEKNRYIWNGRSELPQEVVTLLQNHSQDVILKVDSESITLKHLWDRHIEMNSSPTASLEKQWALHQEKNLLSLPSVSAKPYHRNWLFDSKKKRLFSREDGREIKLSAEILASLDLQPVLIVKQAGIVQLLDLRTETRSTLPVEFQNAQIISFNENGLVTVNATGTKVWRIDAAALTVQLLQDFPGIQGKVMSSFLKVHDRVYDMNFHKYQDISDLEGESRIVVDNGKLLGYKSAAGSILLNRATSVKSKFPTGFLSYYEKDAFVIASMQSSRVYLLNEHLEVAEEKTLPGTCMGNIKNYLFCFNQSNGPRSFYKIEQGQLKLVMSGVDIQWVSDTVYVKKVSEKHQLFLRAGDKLLLTAKSIGYVDHDTVIVANEEGQFLHLLHLSNLAEPVFTNIVPNVNYWAEKVGKDILLYRTGFEFESGILWKRE